MNRPRQLAHVLQTPLFEEFQNFPIPFVVLEGVNFVFLGFDEIGEHAVGEGHGGDGHRPSSLRFDDIKAGFGQHGGFASVGVHVGRDDDGGDAVVGVEQGERHHGANVDGEPFVVDTAALQASISVCIVPRMRKFRIDVEGVRDGTQIVEVVVHHDPFGVGVGLDLVADDGGPCRGVNDEQVCFEIVDGLSGLVKGVAKRSPSGVHVGRQHRVRVNGHHERGDHASLAHAWSSS